MIGRRWLLYLCGGFAVGMILFGLFAPVWAHSWYDPSCCSGDSQTGDCQPIPPESVQLVGDEYVVTLDVGDHPMVTERHVFRKPVRHSRISKDENFHACLWPDEEKLHCLYAPPMSF